MRIEDSSGTSIFGRNPFDLNLKGYTPEMVAYTTSAPPETRLFQARIIQFLQDSIAEWPMCCRYGQAYKKDAEDVRNEAKVWFNTGNEDFILTCDAAGWAPHMALAMYTNVQQSGTVPRLLKNLPSPGKKKPPLGKRKRHFIPHPSLMWELGV